MMYRGWFWVVLAVAGGAQAADDAQQRAAIAAFCPAAGTVVVSTTGDVRAYLGPATNDPELCRQTLNDRPIDLLFNLEQPMSPDAQRVILRRLFPLQAGRKTTGDVPMPGMGNRLAVQDVMEVLREEQITVPAGTFDTWAIQYSPSIRNGERIRRTVRLLWFDKATGVAVRAQTSVNDGYGDLPPDWEAARITRP